MKEEVLDLASNLINEKKRFLFRDINKYCFMTTIYVYDWLARIRSDSLFFSIIGWRPETKFYTRRRKKTHEQKPDPPKFKYRYYEYQICNEMNYVCMYNLTSFAISPLRLSALIFIFNTCTMHIPQALSLKLTLQSIHGSNTVVFIKCCTCTDTGNLGFALNCLVQEAGEYYILQGL